FLDVLLPVGISFYTFQALGYTIDVYRKDIEAEKSFIDYALFVSFFPQLVAGPIERSGNILHQLKEYHPFRFDNIKEGILPALWGLFKKVVVADNLAVIVNQVYNSPKEHTGAEFLVATAAFAFQIYCDFSAYSDIARGSAKMLGF
ncbi:MBOAT family protein, partial [Neglectibacter timonensis]